jgi:hypothetical protein
MQWPYTAIKIHLNCEVHVPSLIAWDVVVGGLQGRIEGSPFPTSIDPIACPPTTSSLLNSLAHFQSHLLPPLIKSFSFMLYAKTPLPGIHHDGRSRWAVSFVIHAHDGGSGLAQLGLQPSIPTTFNSVADFFEGFTDRLSSGRNWVGHTADGPKLFKVGRFLSRHTRRCVKARLGPRKELAIFYPRTADKLQRLFQ